MLYVFKSKATAHLTMLPAHGSRLLQIIGKEPAAQGIVLPEQMPGAMQALEAAIASEEAALREAREAAGSDTDKDAADESAEIRLRQRARPLLDMLRRCHTAGEPIVWGV